MATPAWLRATKWIGCRNMEDGWGSPATYSERRPVDRPLPDWRRPVHGRRPIQSAPRHQQLRACTFEEGCVAVHPALRRRGGTRGRHRHRPARREQRGQLRDGQYSGSYLRRLLHRTHFSDIAFFSSRGPVTIDGSNRRKPDIVAPDKESGRAFRKQLCRIERHQHGLASMLPGWWRY